VTRTFGLGPDGKPRRIDPAAVAQFFDQRAARIRELGPTRAVIYQDRHPDLAERRDRAEKDVLLPKLGLDGRQRVLDVGCGTGRWVDEIAGRAAAYHGIDLTPGLVEFAREAYRDRSNVVFSVASAEDFSLETLHETRGFDRILSAGVMIYLNDDGVERALGCMHEALAGDAPRVLIREPIAQVERLSIIEHFSDDLDATYNAIYRTRAELVEVISDVFGDFGLGLVDHGYVFADDDLNNRAETRQEWFVIGRTP
jgi:SAM-dependent methyltransferase